VHFCVRQTPKAYDERFRRRSEMSLVQIVTPFVFSVISGEQGDPHSPVNKLLFERVGSHHAASHTGMVGIQRSLLRSSFWF
jgi:hypothetical protein